MGKVTIEKVTGSRLPALIGIFGKSKFEDFRKIVSAGLTEKEIIKTDFLNFRRGYLMKVKLWLISTKKPNVMPKNATIFLMQKIVFLVFVHMDY